MRQSERSMPSSVFPDPERAPGDAPLAVGGHLDPETLLDAYRHGIFPWPTSDGTVFWWSPDPRAVFVVGEVHVSKSLRRLLRSGDHTVTRDAAFEEVMRGCADREEGTWIQPSMIRAYTRLHELGRAHSLEVWEGSELVGGIYGVAIGAVFCAESMFHRRSNASKVALVELDRHLRGGGFRLIDAQLFTRHLSTMGVHTVQRQDYLAALRDLRDRPASF